MIDGASVATNATQTGAVDTLGFNFVRFSVHQSVSTAASVLKIEQSDDATNYVSASITGGTDFTIGTHVSSATTAPYYVFDVPTGGRRRYLRLSITPGAAANIVAFAVVGRPGLGEDTENAVNTFPSA